MANALNLHPASEGHIYRVKGTFINKNLLSGPDLSGTEYKRMPIDDGLFGGKNKKEVRDWIHSNMEKARISKITKIK